MDIEAYRRFVVRACIVGTLIGWPAMLALKVAGVSHPLLSWPGIVLGVPGSFVYIGVAMIYGPHLALWLVKKVS